MQQTGAKSYCHVIMVSGATMLRTEAGPVTTHLVVADDVDTFSATLPGLELDIVRTGIGTGPNTTRHAAGADIMLASTSVQFPLLGRATIADDRVVVGFLAAVPDGSRWDGVDLSPGMMMLYGQRAEHSGPDIPGLRYVTVSLSVDRLEETAEQLNLSLGRPPPGMIEVLAPKPRTTRLGNLLRSVDDPRQAKPETILEAQDLFHAFATALSDGSARTSADRRGKISDRLVTSKCIEYAKATGKIPSIPELCLVAHVSERRLRQAFIDVYDMSPLRYFRYRALRRARARLVEMEQVARVGAIAADAGFGSQSRFARFYRDTFGEYPSTTLRPNGMAGTPPTPRSSELFDS